MAKVSGRDPSGQAGRANAPSPSSRSRPSGDHPSRKIDFITFTARGGHGEHTVNLKQPICLYDETPHSPYRAARARAARRIKRQLGIHPCAKLVVEPHDWSEAVDALSAQVLA